MFVGGTPHGRRPRPVAGLPVIDGVAVAKGWLLELLAHTALEDIASVPVDLIAREAPALCEAIAAAVADDAALDRLVSGDRAPFAARAGDLTGATGAADVVTGVEALRVVLHRALRTEADASLAADTGDRLAHVCVQVAARALAVLPVAEAAAPPVAEPPVEPTPEDAPFRTPLSAVPAPVVPPETGERHLVAQDLRPEPAHLAALDAALAAPDQHPVTVLALELDDLERLLSIEGEVEVGAALGPAEGALAAALDPQDVLVREQPGRWWIIAPRTGTDAARRLADGLSRRFGGAAPVRHGAPLTASIGIAVYPDDGADAQTVLEHADQGVFTARALGVPVA